MRSFFSGCSKISPGGKILFFLTAVLLLLLSCNVFLFPGEIPSEKISPLQPVPAETQYTVSEDNISEETEELRDNENYIHDPVYGTLSGRNSDFQKQNRFRNHSPGFCNPVSSAALQFPAERLEDLQISFPFQYYLKNSLPIRAGPSPT